MSVVSVVSVHVCLSSALSEVLYQTTLTNCVILVTIQKLSRPQKYRDKKATNWLPSQKSAQRPEKKI